MTSTRGRRRIATGAALVAALAVAVAGCGGADEPETLEVVPDLDLLEGAEAAGSARISWEVDAEQPFLGIDEEMGLDTGVTVHVAQTAEGVVDLTTRASEWSGTSSSTASFPAGAVDEPEPTPTQHFEARTNADGEWFRMWREGEDPSPWIADTDDESVGDGPTDGEADADTDDGTDTGRGDEDAPATSLSDPTTFDPRVFFEALRAAADSVSVVGEEEVRGDAATRYRVVVDVEEIDPAGSLWPAADGTIDLDVWVDHDDRLRQVEAEGFRLELWDFGTPVAVAAPDEVEADEESAFEGFGFFPELTGEWAPAAGGTSAVGDWQVWAAPATIDGAATTCRTLEVAGGGGALADAFGGMAEAMGEDLPFPVHGGQPAACGNGTFGAATGTFVADPALQILSSMPGPDGVLLGVVVRPDLAAGGVRLEVDGADPVEVPVDAQGIAVWAPAEGQSLVAVQLDGGAIRCALPSLGGDGLDAEAGMLGAMGAGLAPCVRG